MMLRMHQGTMGMHEGTMGMHQGTMGMHQGTMGMHQGNMKMHQGTMGMLAPSFPKFRHQVRYEGWLVGWPQQSLVMS